MEHDSAEPKANTSSMSVLSHTEHIDSSPPPATGAGGDCPTSDIHYKHPPLGMVTPARGADKVLWAPCTQRNQGPVLLTSSAQHSYLSDDLPVTRFFLGKSRHPRETAQ